MAETASTRFEMRAGNDWLRKLDGWRRDQADLPPRAEAIRRLVELGLQVSAFQIGDMVTTDDGRSGTIVDMEDVSLRIARVDFNSLYDELSQDGEAVPFSKLYLEHRNGAD